MPANNKSIADIKEQLKLSEPLTVKTKRELNYTKFPESAVTIPVGTEIQLHFSEVNPGKAYFSYGGFIRTALLVVAHKNFTKIQKPPSVRSIEKMEWERGACKTVLGNITEPDGHDQYGAPSWMLVMGVI